MRLVCVADTHRYESTLNVPDGDVLIHAGDMLDYGTLEELEPVAEWLGTLPHRHKVVIAGNHDWCFARTAVPARNLLQHEAGAIYLQDDEITIDGVRFYGSPWQPEFCNWAFNLPRGEALAAMWAKIPAGVDVLVTHGPPRGYGDRVHRGLEGCDDLLEAIDRVRPAVHVFGHIHEDGGLWQRGPTTIANVTTWMCERAPTVIDYEPATRTVTPIQVPPREIDP
ncbi:metallophosphatase domain-containing protein [Paraliomyxa miuraensis]|uniref:metallophosphatase domain-containing protein n=1 Tax=Paraliomyxa miuraensis TaxID=376150 RepID=UPI0022552A35|nr:metallophosphatase domain-containing protein [Paraliomyxa miuraensis]MCX4241146.1 metallophosphatase domain-containing protein [Paraliomyxa miuraensis]